MEILYSAWGSMSMSSASATLLHQKAVGNHDGSAYTALTSGFLIILD